MQKTENIFGDCVAFILSNPFYLLFNYWSMIWQNHLPHKIESAYTENGRLGRVGCKDVHANEVEFYCLCTCHFHLLIFFGCLSFLFYYFWFFNHILHIYELHRKSCDELKSSPNKIFWLAEKFRTNITHKWDVVYFLLYDTSKWISMKWEKLHNLQSLQIEKIKWPCYNYHRTFLTQLRHHVRRSHIYSLLYIHNQHSHPLSRL